ncbi:Major fimbrial subunit precursor [compost metagenome]
MLFKRLSLATLVAVASQAALASPTTSIIHFKGSVLGNTCDISVNGVTTPNPATVILNDALAERLGKAGDTDGKSAFSIDLKNCAGTATKVRASFKGANGTTITNGRLDNMAGAAGAAKNVQLQLEQTYGASDGVIQVAGDQTAQPYADIAAGAATLGYAVQYYATGAATEGKVEGAVEYTIQYQ